jgi:hypothetical protein
MFVGVTSLGIWTALYAIALLFLMGIRKGDHSDDETNDQDVS